MAIGATINKVSLNVANMDRQYYQTHELTVAQHPSENEYRFMIRLIAFALNAHERLVFTKGLAAEYEPELWLKTLSGEIELWVDFGQVDEKRIRRACGRSQKVIVYTYQERKSTVWWAQYREKLARHKNLSICHIQADGADELVNRSMSLQCTIDDGSLYLSDDSKSISVTVSPLNQ